MPEKKITIEVLVSMPNGELAFKPVTGTKKEIIELLKKEGNEIVRHSIENELKEKGIKA